MRPGREWLSMREAVLTVSPMMVYLTPWRGEVGGGWGRGGGFGERPSCGKPGARGEEGADGREKPRWGESGRAAGRAGIGRGWGAGLCSDDGGGDGAAVHADADLHPRSRVRALLVHRHLPGRHHRRHGEAGQPRRVVVVLARPRGQPRPCRRWATRRARAGRKRGGGEEGGAGGRRSRDKARGVGRRAAGGGREAPARRGGWWRQGRRR
jgi:hypothetical protein